MTGDNFIVQNPYVYVTNVDLARMRLSQWIRNDINDLELTSQLSRKALETLDDNNYFRLTGV